MTRKKELSPGGKKRSYRTPALKTHGDLKKLTMAKGGTKSEGAGNPRTRV